MQEPRFWGSITALQARSFDERCHCHPSFHVREIRRRKTEGSGGAASDGTVGHVGMEGKEEEGESGHKHHARPRPRMQLSHSGNQLLDGPTPEGRREREREGQGLRPEQ